MAEPDDPPDSTLPVPAAPVPLPNGPAEAALEVAKSYARRAHAPATLRAYAADWADFTHWCRQAGLIALPATPAAVAAYLASLAPTHGRSALKRRLAAIGYQHRRKEREWLLHRAIRAPCAGSSAPTPAGTARPQR